MGRKRNESGVEGKGVGIGKGSEVDLGGRIALREGSERVYKCIDGSRDVRKVKKAVLGEKKSVRSEYRGKDRRRMHYMEKNRMKSGLRVGRGRRERARESLFMDVSREV